MTRCRPKVKPVNEIESHARVNGGRVLDRMNRMNRIQQERTGTDQAQRQPHIEQRTTKALIL